MTIYRHIKPDDLQFWKEGSVRLWSFEAIRAMEGEAPGIQDELEGRSTGILNYSSDSSSDIIRERLNATGVFNIKPGLKGVVIENSLTTRDAGNHYILCFTTSSTPNLFGPERSVVLTIMHPPSLFCGIHETLGWRHDAGHIGFVKYEDRVVRIEEGDMPQPHPLLKRPEFARQCEYRFYWPAKAGAPDYIDAKSPRIAEMVTRWNPKFFR
jgi:hypothetical protein